MSPIRPSLVGRPRPPRPAQVRRVHCPGCSHSFEVSRRAIILRCPKCTGPVRLEDYTLRDQQEVELSTMGDVHVIAGAMINGNVICGRLINDGTLDGQLDVAGELELAPQSVTSGHITARSLHVRQGATLQARMTIGPVPKKSA